MKQVTVVGAGIVGLTTAIALQEKGFVVKIVAMELPENTLSHKVGAIWYPYDVHPPAQTNKWAARAYKRYEEDNGKYKGLSFLDFMVVSKIGSDDSWTAKLPTGKVRMASAEELPFGAERAHVATVPLTEPPLYLPALMTHFLNEGGKVEQVTITSLHEMAKLDQLVVNCSGLGARTLCGDPDLIPMRGQILRASWMNVAAFVNSTEKNELSYVIRRSADCILGGTDYDNDWNENIDEADTELILSRLKETSLLKEEPHILEIIVGLRPKRFAVRFEWDDKYPNIFHNYGHSGAGFTLAWGCALDLAEKFESIF